MIQFIELIPIELKNENFEEEMDDFINSKPFGVPPQKYYVRHENKTLGLTVQAELKLGELVEVDGNKFLVQIIGPKEFKIQGNMIQNIYILRQ